MVSRYVALCLCLCLGCSGEILSRAAPSGAAPSPTDPEAPLEGPREDDPFALDHASVRLLPFETRLARVASIAGVPTDHEALASLREARIALGDYDHSRNILPDDQWTATRMSAWIRASRPVCASAVMRERYPSVGADPSPLMRAAWGREPLGPELDELRAELGALPPATRDEVACLAVLSSTELVLR